MTHRHFVLLVRQVSVELFGPVLGRPVVELEYGFHSQQIGQSVTDRLVDEQTEEV